ncbi:MAG TPA: DUF362 domain-containing protein [bacterium]|mgnify:CR=1 FL=1|nr:DUF362 domain-containing protein [bacterium]HQI48225.1 DUF362 domain-containing protein [bacterium]HQJ65111.1 DUF362 domain-containing protein [bacterium]
MRHRRYQNQSCHQQNLRKHSLWRRLLFIFFGLGSTLWFLIRVIPKPSRASYPCMRAAAPLASSFVVYLLGVAASLVSLRKARFQLQHSRYGKALLCIAAALLGLLLVISARHAPTFANTTLAGQTSNQPIGTARGIFPGRVVWVHDASATNEKANPALYGSGWFLSKNNNQDVIDRMLSTALRSLTGQTSDSASWDVVFRFYNREHGKGEVGYRPGEKILIKTNATSAWSGNYSTMDLSVLFNSSYGISETSPQLVLAVLRHLVRTVGVAEMDIFVGDPMKHIYKHCYDLWYAEFPRVNYVDHDYGSEKGRCKMTSEAAPSIFYSDKGKVLGSEARSDKLYSIFDDIEYLINIPTMKAHSFAGVTMFAKNHFGSHTRSSANHLHKGLVAANDQRGVPTRTGYGLYRVQVDLMGHKVLGGKNLILLMDALWSSDLEIGPPVKFRMMPFNDDWTSSILVSLDPVAIESVGYDILHTEFTAERGLNAFPQMSGVDDYLHQAASSDNWPAGIRYDPEDDGTPIASLGAHEHWNSSADMQYTRNLGTGNGIELVRFEKATAIESARAGKALAAEFRLLPNHPNPFNAATALNYQLTASGRVQLALYALTGQKIRTLVDEERPAGRYTVLWDGRDDDGNAAASGTYFCRLRVEREGRRFSDSRRLTLVR